MASEKVKRVAMSFEEIVTRIDKLVDNGHKISVITYSLPDDAEKKIDIIIEKILEKYGKQNLKSALYTAIKELAVNGTKANMKAIFFEENGWDMNDSNDYVIGTRRYKELFSEKWASEYGKKSARKGRYVKLTFTHSKDGFCVEVVNNTPISNIDEKRLREKLSKTMKYEDIVQFYMEQSNDSDEGAGMGIALIVMLLKGEGIDPNYFRIGIVDRITTSRIEVPFTSDYIFVRDRKRADSDNS